ncbi:MAG: folate family ECF transporter S component, partial [Clostridiales Family XIII bacterium]|nr:folate family ECF transporter S component [Clostridiales Family XIII bacterium]
GDPLGFVANAGSGGAYFPGFALSEMISCFIFAVFFYKRRITWLRVFFAWILNLAIVTLGMNSLWLMLMYGMDAGAVFATMRVVSNLAQSPLHIILLYFVLRKIEDLRRA